jgi:hypothetical protein
VNGPGLRRNGSADPLFPQSSTFPLTEHGDVQFPLVHTPGTLRPFAATLAVPPPPETKKHDTASTRPATSVATERSDDGKVYPDSRGDTGTDS